MKQKRQRFLRNIVAGFTSDVSEIWFGRVNHAQTFVSKQNNIESIENFWSGQTADANV